jgi:hypothetical protein
MLHVSESIGDAAGPPARWKGKSFFLRSRFMRICLYAHILHIFFMQVKSQVQIELIRKCDEALLKRRRSTAHSKKINALPPLAEIGGKCERQN